MSPSSAVAARLSGRGDDGASLAFVLHLISLVAGGATIMVLTRRAWFFGDDFEYIARFATGRLQLLTPHNEHWSTIPILTYRGLFAVFGLHTYVPYMAVLAVLHLGVAHLLWRVMRRAGVNAWLASFLVLPFLVLGVAFEDLLWAFQIMFLGAVLLGLTQVILADHGSAGFGRRDIAAWVAGVLAVMCSGMGVAMLACAILAALFRRGVRAAIVAGSVPLAVYVLWLAAIGHKAFGHENVSLGDTVLGYPDYLWTGARDTVDGLVGLAGAAPILLVGLVAFLIWRRQQATVTAAPWALALGVVVLLALTASLRLTSGNGVASRYEYVIAAMLLPAFGVALTWVSRGQRALILALAAALCMSAVNALGTLRTQARARNDRDQLVKARVLAGADLVRSNAVLVGDLPEPQWDPDVTVPVLRELIARGKLPEEVPTDPDANAFAISQLQVAGYPSRPAGTSPAGFQVLAAADARVEPAGGGCLAVTAVGEHPAVRLHIAQAGYIAITSSAPGTVHLLMATSPDQAPPQPDREFAVAPSLYLVITRQDVVPVLQPVPQARTMLCPAAATAAPAS